MVATSPTVQPETTSSAGLSTPELRSSTTGGGARSTATDRPSDPVPLTLPPAAPSASATTAASAAPSASATTAASAAPSASATTPASTVPPASATTSATAAPLSCPPWLPLALWDVMSAKARVTAWTDAVRMASGAAVDADRAAAQLAQDALADEEFLCEVSAREEELKHLRANRASNAQKIQDLEALQQQYDRQRSQLAATLTADRRQEDHLVEAGRQAERRREGELRDRAKRSPCVSGAGGRPASTASAAPSRTYAAAASCSPVTRSSSSRHGPVTFESGDFGFTPATLADVANSPQFNFLPEDRASVKDLAADMFNALPAAVTIQEAIDVANTSRPDLRDLASRLLAGMRKANARATAPGQEGATVALESGEWSWQLRRRVWLEFGWSLASASRALFFFGGREP
ncbi:unnamed protein product [Ectocarpus sp. CCAP 1310/34]|nr:unnamed protein product [Ectocarpus sp. CCAP 1310/34]